MSNKMQDKVMISKLTEEDGQLVMSFHPDLFKSLKLEPDTYFYWERTSDNELVIREIKAQL